MLRRALVAALLLASTAEAQNLALGNAVYQENCAPCHGELGPLPPRAAEDGAIPAYYSGGNYILSVPPGVISNAVVFGVPGSGMNGFGGAISNEQLGALIAYIESFRVPQNDDDSDDPDDD